MRRRSSRADVDRPYENATTRTETIHARRKSRVDRARAPHWRLSPRFPLSTWWFLTRHTEDSSLGQDPLGHLDRTMVCNTQIAVSAVDDSESVSGLEPFASPRENERVKSSSRVWSIVRVLIDVARFGFAVEKTCGRFRGPGSRWRSF